MKPSNAFLIIGLCALQLWTFLSIEFEVLPQHFVEAEEPFTVPHHPQDHRHLQTAAPTPAPSFSDEFAIPFQLIWNMAFSNETTVRTPTEEELTGLFYATLNWLIVSTRDYYAEASNVMRVDRIQFTHYGASFNASAAHPSTVGMECTCYFRANNGGVIPSVFQYLVAFSSGFNRTMFLEEYLAKADPMTSIYRNVTDLRYNIVPSSLGTSGLEIVSLALNTEWKYEIGYGVPDRAPTDDEYEGLQEATNDWLVDNLLDAYPPNPLGNPTFHLLESSIYSRTYDPSQDPPHIVRIMTEVTFRQDQASGPLGITQQDLLNLLNTLDLGQYRDRYLHWAKPDMSLFTGVLSLSWTSV